jgi:hypothetical protein
MLQEGKDLVFLGMTFWDLDYYYGDPIPELLALVDEPAVAESQSPLTFLLPMLDIHRSGTLRAVTASLLFAQNLPSPPPRLNYQAFVDLYQKTYDEHQSLFLQLLGHLHFRPSSKV